MKTDDVISMQTSEMIDIGELRPHPRNYRTHPEDQLEHLAASIREHGFYRNVVITKDGTVLAGHGVIEASRRLGLTEVPVIKMDIHPESRQATKIMAADNTVTHLAEQDDRALTELLKELNDEDDLLGTGYDEQMLVALAMVTRPASELNDFDAAAEWLGMPSYETSNNPLKLIVSFETPEDRVSFFNELGIELKSESMKSIWWPMKAERDDVSSVAFVATGNQEETV